MKLLQPKLGRSMEQNIARTTDAMRVVSLSPPCRTSCLRWENPSLVRCNMAFILAEMMYPVLVVVRGNFGPCKMLYSLYSL